MYNTTHSSEKWPCVRKVPANHPGPALCHHTHNSRCSPRTQSTHWLTHGTGYSKLCRCCRQTLAPSEKVNEIIARPAKCQILIISSFLCLFSTGTGEIFNNCKQKVPLSILFTSMMFQGKVWDCELKEAIVMQSDTWTRQDRWILKFFSEWGQINVNRMPQGYIPSQPSWHSEDFHLC